MSYYSLLIVDKHKSLSTPAKDRVEALRIFGSQIGVHLTLESESVSAPYLLDEWEESPHWVNHTIPVFVK